MSPSRRRVAPWMLLAACLAAPCAGCGRIQPDRLARPSGTILYQGEPIHRGFLYFAPIGKGLPAHGEVNHGAFAALTTEKFDDGIRPGAYRISLLPVPDESPPVKASKKARADLYPVVVTISGKPIPARYCDVAASPLKVQIPPGMKSIALDLAK